MLVPRLVIGLGNPGPRFTGTRHNVGYRLVELFSEKGVVWKNFKGLGRYWHRDAVTVGEPETYMNESGRFVAALARYYKIPAEETLICFDDMDLPLGRLRIRLKGSAGGHKGMKSIIDHMGTPEIPRLRIGIGPITPGREGADFVLGRFSKAEKKILDGSLDSARNAIATAIEEGVEAAMNRFNPAP